MGRRGADGAWEKMPRGSQGDKHCVEWSQSLVRGQAWRVEEQVVVMVGGRADWQNVMGADPCIGRTLDAEWRAISSLISAPETETRWSTLDGQAASPWVAGQKPWSNVEAWGAPIRRRRRSR